MDTLDSKKLSVLEIDNELKKFEAYLNDERVSSFSEVYKGCEEIKALLNEMKFYTEVKCELEKGLMQEECKIKQTQNLYKIIDEDKKNHDELQILVQQKEKNNFELLEKYEAMMMGKSKRLRDSHKYYKKENRVKELAMMEEEFEEWSKKKKQAQNVIDELQRESDEMRPSVPYDIFNSIMGKEANGKKVKGNNPKNNKTSKK